MLGEGALRVEANIELRTQEVFFFLRVVIWEGPGVALLGPVQVSRVLCDVVDLAVRNGRLRDAALRALGEDQGKVRR